MDTLKLSGVLTYTCKAGKRERINTCPLPFIFPNCTGVKCNKPTSADWSLAVVLRWSKKERSSIINYIEKIANSNKVEEIGESLILIRKRQVIKKLGKDTPYGYYI